MAASKSVTVYWQGN